MPGNCISWYAYNGICLNKADFCLNWGQLDNMRKVIAILIILVFILVFLMNYRPRPSQLNGYLVKTPIQTTKSELTVQFLGNTNLLFSDGETSILTDGFFTRPSPFTVLFGEVAPSKKVIKYCLQKAKITNLDAVIPLHSHYDHAMDAPMVADLTGAQLIGSSSTVNIGRGYGLKEQQITIPTLDSTIKIGAFQLTFIKSDHWQYPDPEQRAALLNNKIEQPLVTPASIYDYKEGDTYTLLLEHGTTKIAIQGSAGYKENSLPPFDADLLFLSIAGLETMSEAYNQAYQDHLIAPLKAEVLIPIHWDDFTVPLSDKPLRTTSMLINLKFGSNLTKAFEEVEKRNKGKVIKVLPVFETVAVRQLVNGN